MIEKAQGVHQTKEDILALYGVHKSKEDILALYGAHQAKDEMAPRGMEEVIDLTDTPPKKPPSTQDTTKGRHKVYFDFHRRKVVRPWADGTVEVSNTKEGDDGFMIGEFEDGFTFTSEVPNVAFHALESFQPKGKKRLFERNLPRQSQWRSLRNQKKNQGLMMVHLQFFQPERTLWCMCLFHMFQHCVVGVAILPTFMCSTCLSGPRK